MQQAASELPGVKIRMGRLSDFGDAILKENPKLPVVRADLADTWIKGIMSMPVETKLARNVRPQIAALDALGTLLPAWGVRVPSNRDTVAAAYEGSLMFGEHTWGYRRQAVSPPVWQGLGASPCRGPVCTAGRFLGRKGRLHRQSRGRNPRRRQGRPGGPGPRRCAWRDNALSCSIHCLGRATAWLRCSSPAGVSYGLKDLATGQTVPCQQDGETLSFLARNVPAMGYRTYVPVEGAAAPDAAGGPPADSSTTLENSFFRTAARSGPRSRGVAGRQAIGPRVG